MSRSSLHGQNARSLAGPGPARAANETGTQSRTRISIMQIRASSLGARGLFAIWATRESMIRVVRR